MARKEITQWHVVDTKRAAKSAKPLQQSEGLNGRVRKYSPVYMEQS